MWVSCFMMTKGQTARRNKQEQRKRCAHSQRLSRVHSFYFDSVCLRAVGAFCYYTQPVSCTLITKGSVQASSVHTAMDDPGVGTDKHRTPNAAEIVDLRCV